MINEVNAVVFRQNLGDMLNQVQYRHDSILIKKDGKPVAALVDAQLFDRIRRFKKKVCTSLSRRMGRATRNPSAKLTPLLLTTSN